MQAVFQFNKGSKKYEETLQDTIKKLGKSMLGSLRDLLPIVSVILFFQFLVLQQPLPNVATANCGPDFLLYWV